MYRVKTLHQIEITSRCNLRCKYCVHPKMQRPKMDMEDSVYKKCLSWASHFVTKNGQQELNLAGVGESTMHPKFAEYVELARRAVGPNCRLVLATNGILINEEIAKVLKANDVWTWVSLHRPEKAGLAVEILKTYGVLKGVSNDPSVSAMNWAGQVNWHVSTAKRQCFWIKGGRVMVQADGLIVQCCLDGEGYSGKGHIMTTNLENLASAPYSLCKTCDQDAGVPLQEAV